MPEEVNQKPFANGKQESPSKQQHVSKASKKPWFTTPAPIKRLFDIFPLITYPPNELPQRKERISAQLTLYIFATEEGVREGRPSFNPGCLKWQAC
jgi:metaxin